VGRFVASGGRRVRTTKLRVRGARLLAYARLAKWHYQEPLLLGDYRRIYLHHIRKTGGTSVTNSFLSLTGEDPLEIQRRLVGTRPRATRAGDFVVAAHDELLLRTGWFTYGWSHMPSWGLHLPRRTYTVTVLRDPIARIVSLFRYLSDPASDAGHAFTAAPGERARAADGFDAFISRTERHELFNQLWMFSPTYDVQEAADRIGRCSLVYFLEDIEYGMATFSSFVGHPLPVRRERRSQTTFSPSEAQRERLGEMLQPEFDLLERVRPIAVRRPEQSSGS